MSTVISFLSFWARYSDLSSSLIEYLSSPYLWIITLPLRQLEAIQPQQRSPFCTSNGLERRGQEKGASRTRLAIGPNRLPTWDDHMSLSYIDAILKETL